MPILLGIYLAAIPFFIALLQALKLLRQIDLGRAFSSVSITALRRIKQCGLSISAIFAVGMPYVFYIADRDDAPGLVAMVPVIIFASFIVATFAGVLQQLLQSAAELRSDNDLTV